MPVRATEPKLVQLDPYYHSEPDPHFQAQYPDVATIPLLYHIAGKNQDELVTCLVNTSGWEVVLPKNKTVSHICCVCGQVQINKIVLEHNHETILPEKVEPIGKELNTGMVMLADYSPHYKVELEDYEITTATKKKLKDLFEHFDSIVSKHTNDINTTPLLKMEIQTEGPPIASHPYVLPLKHHSFVCKEIEYLERAGVIQKSLSPYASPIVVVPKKAPPGAPESEQKQLVIDYRKLNKQLPFVQKADSNAKGVISLIPLPKIDELFSKLKGAKVFSTIDLRQGYHHIALTEDSIPKTAFSAPWGKWEFLKCPFG